MAQLLVLAALSGLVDPLQSSFPGKTSAVCRFVIYITAMGLVMWDLQGYLELSSQTMTQMVDFVRGVFPVLVTLMTALGGLASASVFQPAFAMIAGLVSNVFGSVLMPLLLVAGVMSMLQHMSDKVRLANAITLLKSTISWIIGCVCTLYLGVLALKGMVAGSHDGLVARTAQYAIGTFVPVVGSMFSNSAELLTGCSVLVKNAVGVAGLAGVAVVCLLPALRIVIGMMMYKLVAALAEPLGDTLLANAMNDLSGILRLLFVALISVGLMLFITITLLLGTGSLRAAIP